MQKTLIGILVTSVALFFYGFLYWGINPVPYESFNQAADDEAAQMALASQFPESGTYLVPGRGHEPEKFSALSEKGPIALLHIKAEGVSATDPATMISGFALTVVVTALLAALFRVAGATEFRDFARLSVVLGAVAVVMIDGGRMVWWHESLTWTIWQGIYDFVFILIAGHLLGVFMKKA